MWLNRFAVPLRTTFEGHSARDDRLQRQRPLVGGRASVGEVARLVARPASRRQRRASSHGGARGDHQLGRTCEWPGCLAEGRQPRLPADRSRRVGRSDWPRALRRDRRATRAVPAGLHSALRQRSGRARAAGRIAHGRRMDECSHDRRSALVERRLRCRGGGQLGRPRGDGKEPGTGKPGVSSHRGTALRPAPQAGPER